MPSGGAFKRLVLLVWFISAEGNKGYCEGTPLRSGSGTEGGGVRLPLDVTVPTLLLALMTCQRRTEGCEAERAVL